MSNRFVKYKNREWFEKNAYEDDESDWWISEAEYQQWDNSSTGDTKTDFVRDIVIGKAKVLRKSYDDEWESDPFDWAIDFTITKETHPEYFL